jgi:type IV pilus assembly protein PilC
VAKRNKHSQARAENTLDANRDAVPRRGLFGWLFPFFARSTGNSRRRNQLLSDAPSTRKHSRQKRRVELQNVHEELESRVTAAFDDVQPTRITDMDPEVEAFLRELHRSLEQKHRLPRSASASRKKSSPKQAKDAGPSLFDRLLKRAERPSMSSEPIVSQKPNESEVITMETPVVPEKEPQKKEEKNEEVSFDTALEAALQATAEQAPEPIVPTLPKRKRAGLGSRIRGMLGSIRKQRSAAKQPAVAGGDDTIVLRSDDAPVAQPAQDMPPVEEVLPEDSVQTEETTLQSLQSNLDFGSLPVPALPTEDLQMPERESLLSRLRKRLPKRPAPAPSLPATAAASAPVAATPKKSWLSFLGRRTHATEQASSQPTLSFDATKTPTKAEAQTSTLTPDEELENALASLGAPAPKQKKGEKASIMTDELQWTEAARAPATMPPVPPPGKRAFEKKEQETSWASGAEPTFFGNNSPLTVQPKKRRGFFSQIRQAWSDRFGAVRPASSAQLPAPTTESLQSRTEATAMPEAVAEIVGASTQEEAPAAPVKHRKAKSKKALEEVVNPDDAAKPNVGKLITEREDVEGEDLTEESAPGEVTKSLSTHIKSMRKEEERPKQPTTTEAPKISEKVKKRLEKSKSKAGGFQEFLGAIKYFGLGKERTTIIQNLSTMLNAGLPLIDSLHTLQKETRQKPIKKLLQKVIDAVENGSALWRALEAQHFFSPHAISLIRIGEEAGNLAKNLENLAIQEEKDAALKGKIKMAMIYPSIVIVLMFIIVMGLGLFVLPNLLGVLTSLNAKLPLVTRLLVAFTNYFQAYAAIIVPGMLGGLLFTVILAKFTRLKVVFQWMIFHFPGIGALTRQATIARFGIILGSLLEAGVPLIEALNSLAEVTPTVAYRKFYFRLVEHVNVGDSFSKSFESIRGSQKLLPVTVQQLVTTGERSGSLARILLKIADIYEKKANETAERLPVILEPIILLFIGGLVGLIAFAIIVPIYSVVGSVGKQ